MKYKIGDRVRFIGKREERFIGKIGRISHTKDNPQVEDDIVSGAIIYPKGDFDYTIKMSSSSGIEFVLNAYEREIEYV